MGTTFSYQSGDQARPADVSTIPLFLGTCQGGAVGSSYIFDPGDDVEATLGPGRLTTCVLAFHTNTGKRCVAAPVAPTYPALPSVTKSGTGPAIAIAAIGSGANDAAPLKITVTPDQTALDVAYDGASVVETLPIPQEGPAVLRSKVDTRKGASVSGLTLVWTSPAAKTITFSTGSLAGAPAGLKAATATSASPVTLTESDLLAPGIAETAAHARRLVFTTAGVTPSDAPASVVITAHDNAGATQTETLSLAQTAASVTSLKEYDLTTCTIAYAAADGTGATVAVGYKDAHADTAELASDFNTLAAAAPLAIRARTYEASTGEEYFELYSAGSGVGVSATIDDATSTADTLLGFNSSAPSNITATGTAAAVTFAWLGFTATCAAGSYSSAEVYTINLAGPRGSVMAYSDALDTAIDNYGTKPFGYVVVVEELATNTVARTLYDTLRATAATKRSDPDAPVLFDVVTPTAFHAASATRATNDAAIATFDAGLLVAMTGAAASLENIAIDDCYVSGPPKMPGTFRRPATWAAAFKRSTLQRIAGNPCDGTVGVSLRAADGATYARDEARASTKLGRLAGAGYWTLKSTVDGGTKFESSATRAGALSRYRNPGAVAIALAMSRAILPQLQAWEGTWEGDEDSPIAISPDQAQHRAGVLEALIDPVAYPVNQPKNVTKYSVTITGATTGDDGDVQVALVFNPLLVAESVTVTVTATGVAIGAAEA